MGNHLTHASFRPLLILLFTASFIRAQLEIVSTNPDANAINVVSNIGISVTFNSHMTQDAFRAATFAVNSSQKGWVDGTYTYDIVTKTATFTAEDEFFPGEVVSVHLTDSLQNANGDTLSHPYVWSFRIGVPLSSGSYRPGSVLNTSPTPAFVFVDDLDRDGDLDLLTYNYTSSPTVDVHLNDGQGNFTVYNQYPGFGPYPSDVLLMDVERDGDIDLVSAHMDEKAVHIQTNDGNGGGFNSGSGGAGWTDRRPSVLSDGDWNGDGRMDMVIGFRDRNQADIWYGTWGILSRYDGLVVNLPFPAAAFASGDWNGDGTQDLAVTYDDSSFWHAGDTTAGFISLFIGSQISGFLEYLIDGAGAVPASIATGDWDGDGDLDLVIGDSYDQSIRIMTNDGTGGFTKTSTLMVEGGPHQFAVYDYDGDVDLDIGVACQSSNSVWLFTNDGNGSFKLNQTLRPGGGPALAHGDIDGDGDIDLAITSKEQNTFNIYLNQNLAADVEVTPKAADFGGVRIFTEKIHEFTVTNRGLRDTLEITTLAVSDPAFSVSTGTISIPPQDSTSFSIIFSPSEIKAYAAELTIISNDPIKPQLRIPLSGKILLVIDNSPIANTLSSALDGSVTATFAVDISPGTVKGETFRVYASRTGLVTGNVSYAENTRTASFELGNILKVGELVSVILTDGIQDYSGQSLSPYQWRYNTSAQGGSGNFLPVDTVEYTGYEAFGITPGDFDRDGDEDVILVNYPASSISILKNDGSGYFTSSSLPPHGAERAIHVESGDWDGDSDLDIVVGFVSPNRLATYLNDGNGVFTSGWYSDVTYVHSIASGDFNGDGHIDIGLIGLNSIDADGTIGLFQNDGTGRFTLAQEITAGPGEISPQDLAVGDWDNDGDLDLAVMNAFDGVFLLLNDGQGMFSLGRSYQVGQFLTTIEAGDWNGDRHLDLVMADEGLNKLHFLINDGRGRFGASYSLSVGDLPWRLAKGDWDGDGDVDLAVSNLVGYSVWILTNDGTGVFNRTQTHGLGAHSGALAVGDWDNNGTLDLVVSNRGESIPSRAISLLNEDIFAASLTLRDQMREQSDSIRIDYRISNPASYPTSIHIDYSLDDGSTWDLPSIIGNTSALPVGQYRGNVIWDSYADHPGEDIPSVILRIIPYDQTGQGGAYTTPDFRLDNNRAPAAVLTPVAEGEHRGDITVEYQLSDPENDSLGIRVEYLEPDFGFWQQANITGDTASIPPTAYSDQVIWRSENDLPEGVGYYSLRITPYDNDLGNADTVEILIDQVGAPIAVAISQFDAELSGDIEVAYTLWDDELDTLHIITQYSAYSGHNWAGATISGDTAGILPADYSDTLIWHSAADLPGVDRTTVRFRITPVDYYSGIPIETDDFHLDNNDPPALVLGAAGDTIVSMLTLPYTLSDTESDSLTLSASYSLDQGASWQEGHLDYARGKIAPADYAGTVDWLAFADLPGKHTDVQLQIVPADYDPGVGDTLTGLTVIYRPGDYSGDLLISTGDLALFAAAWNATPQDLAYEIGPATGTVPELTPQPDGVLDFEDLTVFAMMWNWSFAHNGFAKSIPTLAKAITENTTIRLVQRIPEDLYRWDGTILMDMFVDGTEGLMMVDGIVSYASGSLQLIEVADGGYLRQLFKATPLLTQVSPDSSQVLFAMAGLGTVEPGKVDDLPVAILRFRPKAHKSPPLILDYTLTGMDGGPFEAGQVQLEVENLLPTEFALHQNYPNPFNPNTTIRFELPKATKVYLVVYDILGREVTRLKQEQLGAGYHQVLWDSRDQAGRDLASGIYFARLVTPEYSKSMKMLLLK